jgi:hypothetical protein
MMYSNTFSATLAPDEGRITMSLLLVFGLPFMPPEGVGERGVGEVGGDRGKAELFSPIWSSKLGCVIK